VSIAQAPVWGLGRTIDHEHPELRCTRVDLSARGGEKELRALFNEVWADSREVDVALRGSRRFVARLARYDAEPAETPGGAEVSKACSAFDGFKAEATYLITGGLGALGCAVATWMAQQGARHLVLMARGAPSESAQETLDALREAGIQVVVARGDVTNADQVGAVLESIGTWMPPLRGVVHAAGIIDDGILQRLNERQLLDVMAPKVQGAWNLHMLTRDAALDFFVLFSSAASLLGSPGAANYAAANAFLDALAWHRRAGGRAALSIDWGPWAGLGFSARSQQRGQFAQHGIEDMSAAECLRALTYLHPRSATQVAVLDIDWSRWLPTINAPLLADLQPEPRAERGPESGLYATLHGATPQERQRLLESYLRDLAAGKLGLAPSSLDIRSPLTHLGVDSLITLELRIQIERDLGITVPVAQLLDGPSVASLAGWLGNQLVLPAAGTHTAQPDGASPQKTAPEEKPETPPSRGIDLLTRVPELSDDSVEELLQKVIADRKPGMKEGSDDG
jgi:acyl carrier protein